MTHETEETSLGRPSEVSERRRVGWLPWRENGRRGKRGVPQLKESGEAAGRGGLSGGASGTWVEAEVGRKRSTWLSYVGGVGLEKGGGERFVWEERTVIAVGKRCENRGRRMGCRRVGVDCEGVEGENRTSRRVVEVAAGQEEVSLSRTGRAKEPIARRWMYAMVGAKDIRRRSESSPPLRRWGIPFLVRSFERAAKSPRPG